MCNETPDTRPGHYYVSAIDGPQYWLLSGPYNKHEDALRHVEQVREICVAREPKSHFYAFGTCRRDLMPIPPIGSLQRAGIRVGSMDYDR